MTTSFLDTNVLIYFAISDPAKAARAGALLAGGGLVSVQVLNEFTDVLRRKMRLDWTETVQALDLVKQLVSVTPMTLDTHEQAVLLASRYSLRIYDAMIVAAALLAGCDILYSEDMQHGMSLGGRLRIVNPFV